MNDLTSWDNYSDISEDDEMEGQVNDNIKKILLRKYTQYVKEALSESELKDILIQSNYKDEEIKRRVDDKLNNLMVGRVKEWKSKENWKYQGKKVSQGSTSTNGVKSSNIVNTIDVNNINNVSSASTTSTSTHYKNPYYVNGYSIRETESSAKYTANNKFTKNNKMNSNSKNSFQNYVVNNTNVITNNNHKIVPTIIKPEDDIDHYFVAALQNNNKISSNEVMNTNETDIISNVITKERSSSRLSQDDIKEFVEEIKKNKDLIQKKRKDSLTNKETNESSLVLEQVTTQNDTSNTKTDWDCLEESKLESQNSKDKSNYELNEESEMTIDYDLSKIPNNFLNADNYSNYFYQNNKSERKDKTKYENINDNNNKDNLNKNTYVNMQMNMNMNMTMNMQMYPQPQAGGFYNPMLMPNVGFQPVFYPMQGMDPRMFYGPYFNPNGPYPMYPMNNFPQPQGFHTPQSQAYKTPK